MMFFFAGFSFLFLFSCSKIETGLRLAPRLITGVVDDSFDFKSAKLSGLREQIEKDLTANKKQIALKAVSHIDALIELSNKEKMAAGDIKIFVNSLKETQSDLVMQFKSSFEYALSELQDKEISYFKKYTDKKFTKELEETTDREDFLSDRSKSMTKIYDYFFDDLSAEQKKLVKSFVGKHYDFFVERIKIRKLFLDAFHVKILAKQPSVDYVMNYYSGNAKEFNGGLIEAYLEDFYLFQAEFWNMTSADQRENFRKLIKSYKDELKKIAEI